MNDFIDWLSKFLLVICVVVLICLFVALPFVVQNQNRFYRECEAKGGVPMSIRIEGLRCFAKEAVL